MSIYIDKLTGNVYDFDIAIPTTSPLYAMKTSQTTVINTTTLTDISTGMSTGTGTILFPANFFKLNTMYRMHAKGNWFNNTGAQQGFALNSYLNTTPLNGGPTNPNGGNNTGQLPEWDFDQCFYFTSLGVTGQCISTQTGIRNQNDTSGAFQNAVRGLGSQSPLLKSPFTINTTIPQLLFLAATLSAASVNLYLICNSIEVSIASV